MVRPSNAAVRNPPGPNTLALMADFKPDITFLKDNDPSGRMYELMRQLIDSHNHVARQVNASPVGIMDSPPPISSINAVGAGGNHAVVITDNNPVKQGIIYHFEYSSSPNFPTGQVYLAQSGPSRSLTGFALGKGKFFWRGYSQYPGSPPSAPVYYGTQSNPTGVDAGGSITGPAAPPSTGSGTDQGLFPQGGQGFGPGPGSRATKNLIA